MAGAGIHPYHQQWPPAGAPPPPAAVSSAAPPHPPPVHHHHPPPPGLVDNHNRPPFDEVTTLSLSLYIHINVVLMIHVTCDRLFFRQAFLILFKVGIFICLLFAIQYSLQAAINVPVSINSITLIFLMDDIAKP